MKHDSLIEILRRRFAQALANVAGQPPEAIDPQVRPAGDPQFGDYQCNAAMPLAKPLRAKPRDIAQRIIGELGDSLAGVIEPPEIAGPGFINIRIKPEFLAEYLGDVPPPREQPAAAESSAAPLRQISRKTLFPDLLGLPPVDAPHRVVIDYSSPNIAKQMHVGHLRSTIIGDIFARVLLCEGHEVVRQNHVGDWGTQFGILIAHYRDHAMPTPESHADLLQAIEDDYKAAQQRFRDDPAFAEAARGAVGQLQSGDAAARRIWEAICALSRQAFINVYQRLDVLLTDEDVCGESFYNDRLAPTLAELQEKLAPGRHPRAQLREDQGAQCIFLYDEQGEPAFKNAESEPLPMIVQKSDGAFLYATTDLAALRYRTTELQFPSGQRGATRLIYVTDARQKLHFQMLFAVARAAGWAGPEVRLEHVTFGSVLGEDRKPLKTRAGQNVKLRELLDEAERRALGLLEERERGNEGAREREEERQQGTEERQQGNEATRQQGREEREQGNEGTREQGERGEGGVANRSAASGGGASDAKDVRNSPSGTRHSIARAVGIGAVKYADLRQDRTSDYVFGWDKLLALQGNTAPYLMYAYARIRSIYRKAAEQADTPDVYAADVRLRLDMPEERALALRLARLRETIDNVAADLEPHVLCGYLYDLAADFMRFYEACPVLQAPDDATRLSRMRLCDLAARTLKLGLGLLGLQALEQM